MIPDPYYGPAFHDQPILALEKVRHIGEPVAVVLAADPHVAEEAVELIDAEYEPLEPVFNEVEAARPGAPLVHDVLKPAGFFADSEAPEGSLGNQCRARFPYSPWRRGKGFRRSRPHLRAHLPLRESDAHTALSPSSRWPNPLESTP